MVKNLPAKAGDMGLNPDPGRSHMLWSNLKLFATTSEPVFWSLGAATAESTRCN